MSKRERSLSQDAPRKHRPFNAPSGPSFGSAISSCSRSETGLMSPRPDSPAAITASTRVEYTGIATPPGVQHFADNSTASTFPMIDADPQASIPTVIKHTTADSFPTFDTGNVIILCNLISPPRQWQLHGAVLARHSPWFKHAIETSSQNSEHFRTWRFFLSEEVDGKIALVLQKATPKSQILGSENQDPTIRSERLPDIVEPTATPSSPSPETPSTLNSPPIAARDQPHADIVDVYNQILGAFYSVPMKIPTTSISDALSTVETFVKISSTLSCTQLIAPSCTTALLSHHLTLPLSISNDPARFLLLAIPLRSTPFFTTALTHIIGAYPTYPWPTPRSALPSPIHQLIHRHAAALDHTCTEIERELLLLTIEIQRSGPVEPEQHKYFDTWFTVQLFRDTLARRFHAIEMGRDGGLRRGALFRQIARGGDAYMPLGEMRELVRRVMPSALAGLEEDLGLLKECAKGIVKDVVRDEAGVGGEVGWLTCVKVGREDVPWENEGE